MCGVIGLICEHFRDDLGRVTADLLKALEYRGYDSTGAAIQGDSEDVDLRKGVGAPSVLADELGITGLGGRILCGQVRWATFGAVDVANSQPHVVTCKTHLYGAHNGNVTNCDDLKQWLVGEGHDVGSDNDGEMVVHAVEHFFALQLAAAPEADRRDHERRRELMRLAIGEAVDRLRGSFAAVVVDPVSRTLWGIKKGSSFYFGMGEQEAGGKLAIASSDLSCVLKLTRVLVPLSEGEVVEYEPGCFQVFRLRPGEPPEPRERRPSRSRLRAKDTALMPPFETFMDQEIHAQKETCRDVLRIFGGGSAQSRLAAPFVDDLAPDEHAQVDEHVERMLDQHTDEAIRSAFDDLMHSPAFRTALGRLPAEFRERCNVPDAELIAGMTSAEAGLFSDLLEMTQSPEERVAVRLLDAHLERVEVAEYGACVTRFSQLCIDTLDRGGRIFLVCCGTSFNAAKAAALFFAELARTEVLPLFPGEFRGQYENTIRDGDLLVAVSQSGETKDLVDVVNLVIDSGRDVARVAMVNNVNSTLAQEKADLVIPLRCGPEIAVPATKSFINQLTVFYCLAVRLAERRLTTGHVIEGQADETELSRRNLNLPALPELIVRTLEETAESVERAAELLYLEPSMHLLATRLLAVAKEGALKVREVVLNHTEGFEGSEFKHGPNTILGFNTIMGPRELSRVLAVLSDAASKLAARDDLPAERRARVVSALMRGAIEPGALGDLNDDDRRLVDGVLDRTTVVDALSDDYPLVFITGPDPKDVALTVSQINTHKIRGAKTVVIAEEDQALRQAAGKAPSGNHTYQSEYIQLPDTGDTLMTVFSATVALQRLALAMSLKKRAFLDQLGIREHGVHPDVPKNVSKSITVD